MSKFKDITYQKFGRLTALYRLQNYHNKHNAYWLCVCKCGNFKEVSLNNLYRGNVRSCGCLHKETMISLCKTHGKTNTRLYHIWQRMKSRCYYSKDNRYQYYGGRGIAVCDEWKDDFMAFYKWAIDNGYRDNLTIDRIDVDGNYEPSNCRWATNNEQAKNKTNNKYYTINGKTYCLKEWCKILNINYKKVWVRLNQLNWTIERVLEL